jgi:hypothetical protein
MKQIWIYIFINIAVIFLSIGVYWQQPALDYNKCPQCDGVEYHKVYSYFSGEVEDYKVLFSFNSRVFVPWCLSFWAEEDLQKGFWYFNLFFTLLAVNALIYLWIALEIPLYLQIIGIAWMLLHWIGIIRYNQYDWITIDVPLYFFQTLLLIFILKKWYVWLVPLAILATLQKESFIPLLGLFCVWQLYQYYRNQSLISLWAGFALVMAIGTKTWVEYSFPALNGEGKSSIITILFFVRETLQNPLDIVRLGIAFFTGYGILACLALSNLKGKHFYYSPFMILLLLYTILFIAFGVLAGRDMTRIVFLGYPFVMTLILALLKHNISRLRLALAILLSVPLLRLLSHIPSASEVHPEVWQSWYPEFAEMGIVSAWGLYIWVAFWIVNKGYAPLEDIFKRNGWIGEQ